MRPRREPLGIAAAALATVLLCAGSAQAVPRGGTLTISPPADITTSANMPCGQSYCAQVYFTFTASGGAPPYNFVCGAYPGSLFLVGSHNVGCLAQDSAGNSTPTATFTVTVTPYAQDVTPPVFSNVPGPLSATADGSGRAVVSWAPITAVDAHDGSTPVHCQPSSGGGDAFPVGVTTVTCTTSDSSANTAMVTFTITIAPAGTTTNTTTTAPATTTAAGTTTGTPATPPPATPPPATTPSTQTLPVAVTTGETTSPPLIYVIHAPSTIEIQRVGGSVYVTITSSDQQSPQTLCWHAVSTKKQTCSRGHGAWRVKLRKTPGKQLFTLKEQGKVVARKTLSINIKA